MSGSVATAMSCSVEVRMRSAESLEWRGRGGAWRAGEQRAGSLARRARLCWEAARDSGAEGALVAASMASETRATHCWRAGSLRATQTKKSLRSASPEGWRRTTMKAWGYSHSEGDTVSTSRRPMGTELRNCRQVLEPLGLA